ncbi:MAG: nucleotide exchange factor GrpE [Panacagrimonas sp.]
MTEPSDPSTGEPSPAVFDPAVELDANMAGLQAKLAEAESRALSARDAHMRTLADMDNLRKRTDREVQQARQYGSEKLLGELLGVADSLDLGLAAAGKPEAQVASIVEGMQLTRRQLVSTLEKHGVKLVDPAGEPFNPDLHEAVTLVESAEVPPNHVVSVMQKGYRLHDRLLRPAMVVVGKAPAAPAPAPGA